MEKNRCYFISFTYRHKKNPGISYGHALIDIHPLEWQIQQYKHRGCEYSLLLWKEIPKADYEKYKGQFGN